MGLSFDEINAEADKQYKPYYVVPGVPGGDVKLRNVIRLPKAERQKVAELNKALEKAQESGDTDALLEAATGLLTIIGERRDGERLVEALGDDPVRLMVVLEDYMGETQPGEASPSGS